MECSSLDAFKVLPESGDSWGCIPTGDDDFCGGISTVPEGDSSSLSDGSLTEAVFFSDGVLFARGIVSVENELGIEDFLCSSSEGAPVDIFLAGVVSESESLTMTGPFLDGAVPSLYPSLFCLKVDELNFLFPSTFFEE